MEIEAKMCLQGLQNVPTVTQTDLLQPQPYQAKRSKNESGRGSQLVLTLPGV